MSTKPRVLIEHSDWHKDIGLRITVRTKHDAFSTGSMYSVADARHLANALLAACEEIENENPRCKQEFIDLGRKLGFID